jgi:hypothetical protein
VKWGIISCRLTMCRELGMHHALPPSDGLAFADLGSFHFGSTVDMRGESRGGAL